jgi:AraC family transcriptional regulator, melibiose operon regulatory protein
MLSYLQLMSQRAAAATLRVESRGLVAGLGSTAPLQEASGHGELELNFVYEGGLRYFIGGRFVDVPKGALTAFWAAMPHQIVEVKPNTEFMYLHLPLGTLLHYNLGSPFMRKVLAGEVVMDPQSPSWDAELTQRWVTDSSSSDPIAWRTCELEVEARLRRLAWKRQQKTAPRSAENKAQKQVEAITAFLAGSYREDISTADIGKAITLHPNYAMTLFRRECGMSIWQYLIRLRLAHAQLMLLTSDKTVLAIALESGFGSLARFYAAFTRECGISPGEFRKRSP